MPRVKVTDFGIAKAAEGLGMDLTRTGTVLGTPRYLSPEQIEGYEPDARADLYALGVVLFEMLTGQPPFVGPTDMSTAVQHLNVHAARRAQPATGHAAGVQRHGPGPPRQASGRPAAVGGGRAPDPRRHRVRRRGRCHLRAGGDRRHRRPRRHRRAGRRRHGPKRRAGHHLPDQCHLDPSPAAPGPELGHDERLDQRSDGHSSPRSRPGPPTSRGPAAGAGPTGRDGSWPCWWWSAIVVVVVVVSAGGGSGGHHERGADTGSGSRRRRRIRSPACRSFIWSATPTTRP